MSLDSMGSHGVALTGAFIIKGLNRSNVQV